MWPGREGSRCLGHPGGEWAAVPKRPAPRRARAALTQPVSSSLILQGWHCPRTYFREEETEQRLLGCGPGASLEPSPRVWERGSRKKGTSVRRGLAVSSRQECEEEEGRAGSPAGGRRGGCPAGGCARLSCARLSCIFTWEPSPAQIAQQSSAAALVIVYISCF